MDTPLPLQFTGVGETAVRTQHGVNRDPLFQALEGLGIYGKGKGKVDVTSESWN